MCRVLIEGLGLFLACLALHVLVWRIRRPDDYRAWLPALGIIFGPVAATIVWFTNVTNVEFAAILLLNGSLSAVYIIGYTLVSAFSPSVELLRTLDRAREGIPMSALRVPFLAGGLTGDRIKNLTTAGLVREHGGRLHLGQAGVRLTFFVLLYRHTVGLPDGEGG